MRIKSILSSREYQKESFWAIVEEWEDGFSELLKAPVINMHSDLFCYKITTKLWCRRLLRRFPFMKNVVFPKGYKVMFEMQPYLPSTPSQFEDFGNKIDAKRIIPYIIDCEFSDRDILLFNEIYKVYPLVLISSRKSYDVLSSFPGGVRIAHLPLSLSDKYRINENTKHKKSFDVAFLGRQEPKFVEFFEQYSASHHGLSVITRKMVNGVCSFVTENGEIIGEANDRTCYMDVLRSVRVVFYSTSHRYPDFKLTEDFVTPKWLEYIACGCHIIAYYPKNSDTEFYSMEKISPSISTYEDFEKAMDFALSHEVDMGKYSKYLERHYTSVRALELEKIVSEL